MSLIRTHESSPNGVEIRFVNWTVQGQSGRLVSLDSGDRPIWTNNARWPEMGLSDATVLYPAVGVQCRHVKKDLRQNLDWEVLHIKTICSLMYGNLQCPCDLCGQSHADEEVTMICPVCMMPTHTTCIDEFIAKHGQISAQVETPAATELSAVLAHLDVSSNDMCKLCLHSLDNSTL